MDWTLISVFLAVADTGSLSEAARTLGTSQPTTGRQIRQLEQLLDVSLFHRRTRGLELTEAGESLLPHARKMREAAHALGLAAASKSNRLSGSVRVTATVSVAAFHLPEILVKLREEEPEITIDLVPSDTAENLLFREADIAVRMFRTDQLDIITKYLGEVSLGMFASKSYLARRGIPKTFEDLQRHDLIGFDRNTNIINGMRDLGMPATRDMFGLRCDNQIVYWEMVRAGGGIGFAQACLGQADPDLVQVVTDFPLPKFPCWLAAHEAMRQTPRVRRVWEALEAGLSPIMDGAH